jgi:hypothetical protein
MEKRMRMILRLHSRTVLLACSPNLLPPKVKAWNHVLQGLTR